VGLVDLRMVQHGCHHRRRFRAASLAPPRPCQPNQVSQRVPNLPGILADAQALNVVVRRFVELVQDEMDAAQVGICILHAAQE
jgi:hypothetical protein